MNKTVYIFHPSYIVQKGLVSVFREMFGVTPVIIEKVEDIDIQPNLKSIVICRDEKSIRKIFHHPDQIKILPIIHDPKPINDIIDLNANREKLEQMLSPIINEFREKQEENFQLTNRETEILKNIALGFTNQEIADSLFISKHTVITHRKNITDKLGIKTISGLTVYAILNNLIDTNTLNIDELI